MHNINIVSPINQLIDLSSTEHVSYNGKVGFGKQTIAKEDAIVAWKAMARTSNGELYCIAHHFEVGETYEVTLPVELCKNGFHCCIDPINCFGYYDYDIRHVMTQVKIWGEIDFGNDPSDDDKLCAQFIEVVQIVPWEIVSNLVNRGKDNVGYLNRGNGNVGNHNVGCYNHGEKNDGHYNYGINNFGSFNIGSGNIGYRNIGHRNNNGKMFAVELRSCMNIGNSNIGIANIGNHSTGFLNRCDYAGGIANKMYHTCFLHTFHPHYLWAENHTIWICDKEVKLSAPYSEMTIMKNDLMRLMDMVMSENFDPKSLSWNPDSNILKDFADQIISIACDFRQLYYSRVMNSNTTISMDNYYV